MIDVRRAGERYRGGEPTAGILTWHAFSFGAHYDPANVGYGLLSACNEEHLAPGAGFAEHPHHDVEIVTWVVEGVLEHRDSAGGLGIVHSGQIQRLSAGSGIRHTESNAGEEPLRFLQMWLHPQVPGGEPVYETIADPASVQPARQPGATLHIGRASMRLPDAPYVYVHVVRGGVRLGAETLGEGDAARITDAQGVLAEADGPAEYLVWEMHSAPMGSDRIIGPTGAFSRYGDGSGGERGRGRQRRLYPGGGHVPGWRRTAPQNQLEPDALSAHPEDGVVEAVPAPVIGDQIENQQPTPLLRIRAERRERYREFGAGVCDADTEDGTRPEQVHGGGTRRVADGVGGELRGQQCGAAGEFVQPVGGEDGFEGGTGDGGAARVSGEVEFVFPARSEGDGGGVWDGSSVFGFRLGCRFVSRFRLLHAGISLCTVRWLLGRVVARRVVGSVGLRVPNGPDAPGGGLSPGPASYVRYGLLVGELGGAVRFQWAGVGSW
jgi:redox-sensitive bicupin YhaK (pirin superfamily)